MRKKMIHFDCGRVERSNKAVMSYLVYMEFSVLNVNRDFCKISFFLFSRSLFEDVHLLADAGIMYNGLNVSRRRRRDEAIWRLECG